MPSFSADSVSFCHWSRPWCALTSALAAGLGVLHRLAQPARDRPRDPLLGSGLQLAAEAAADVGRDDPDLRLGHARRRGQREPEDVRDLGGRPHGDLLTGRVDDDRARLHERRDQPLLAVLALDDDAVGARLGDGVVDVAAGAGLVAVELPVRRLVGAEVGVREHLVGRGALEVEDRRELLVLDVDQLGRVAGLGRGPGHDAGDDLAGAGDPLDGHRQVRRSDLVGRDRPGVDVDALALAEVGAGDHVDDVGRGLRRRRCRSRRSWRARRGCAPSRGAASRAG